MRWEGHYSEDELEQLCAIIHRSDPDAKLTPARLSRLLLDAGFGYAPDASELDIHVDRIVRERPTRPTPAVHYRDIANARTATGLIDKLERHGRVDSLIRTELKAQCRGRRSRRGQILKTTLAQQSRLAAFGLPANADLVREAAQRLAIFHGTQSSAGRPAVDHINFAVTQLANIYAPLIGAADPFMLPSSATSRFVQFVHLAMKPFSAFSQSRSPKAISHRWNDLKRGHPTQRRPRQ